MKIPPNGNPERAQKPQQRGRAGQCGDQRVREREGERLLGFWAVGVVEAYIYVLLGLHSGPVGLVSGFGWCLGWYRMVSYVQKNSPFHSFR